MPAWPIVYVRSDQHSSSFNPLLYPMPVYNTRGATLYANKCFAPTLIPNRVLRSEPARDYKQFPLTMLVNKICPNVRVSTLELS
jgi:hypothetical protein